MKSNTAFSLWPIIPFGGEGDEDNGSAGNGDAQGGAGGNADSEGSQGDSGSGGAGGAQGGKADSASDNDDSDEDEYAGFSAKELKRIAADKSKEASDAKKESARLKAKEDAEERKKNDDVTNLTKDLTTEREVTATLRATVTKQAIIGAIRDDSRFEWHDPEMVAQQLDPEIVKVSDDGKVEGVKASLPKVAKNHPFLLKKDNTKDGGGQGNNGNNGGPTGFQPGQGGASGGGSETDTKKLAENYPALAARM